MQATPLSSLFVSLEKTLSYKKAGQVGFLQDEYPWTCLYTYREKVVRQNVVFISMHEAREKTLL